MPGSGHKVVKFTGVSSIGKTTTILVRGSNRYRIFAEIAFDLWGWSHSFHWALDSLPKNDTFFEKIEYFYDEIDVLNLVAILMVDQFYKFVQGASCDKLTINISAWNLFLGCESPYITITWLEESSIPNYSYYLVSF